MRQRSLVARHLPMYALLVRIAPAGMHPDLGVDAGKLAVERLGEELQIGVRALGLLRAHMGRRVPDPDPTAAWGRHVGPRRGYDGAEGRDSRPRCRVTRRPRESGP